MNKLAKEKLKMLLKDIEEREGKDAAIKAAVSIAMAQYVKGVVIKTAKQELHKSDLPLKLKEWFFSNVEHATNCTPRIINKLLRTPPKSKDSGIRAGDTL